MKIALKHLHTVGYVLPVNTLHKPNNILRAQDLNNIADLTFLAEERRYTVEEIIKEIKFM